MSRSVISFLLHYRWRASLRGDETVAFFSRPVYLQDFPSIGLIDRVVDPLIESIPANQISAKYYVSPWLLSSSLKHKASLIVCPNNHKRYSLLPHHVELITQISTIVGIPKSVLLDRCNRSLGQFMRWFHYGSKFFANRSDLNSIFVSSWYFPDMMGLIAASRLFGITSVDIQHGKQGKYQPMYSGWLIPETGYQLLPDYFGVGVRKVLTISFHQAEKKYSYSFNWWLPLA